MHVFIFIGMRKEIMSIHYHINNAVVVLSPRAKKELIYSLLRPFLMLNKVFQAG